MKLELIPALKIQRELYAIPRGMERFREYLGLLTGGTDDIVTPLGALNPMGREHNAATAAELLAFDAEAVAREALAYAEPHLTRAPGELRLSLVVADNLGGSWSNRYMGELALRTQVAHLEKRNLAEIPCWVSERWTPEAIRRETLAMAYRRAHIRAHGPPQTLDDLMRQEGLAMRFAGAALALPADDVEYSRAVIAPYRLAAETAVLMAALFGDQAARDFGYEPLGLSPWAGLNVALDDALHSEQTPEAALR